jgi:hypothetical protein
VLNAEALIGLPDDGERGLKPMREPMNCEKKERLVGMVFVVGLNDGLLMGGCAVFKTQIYGVRIGDCRARRISDRIRRRRNESMLSKSSTGDNLVFNPNACPRTRLAASWTSTRPTGPDLGQLANRDERRLILNWTGGA